MFAANAYMQVASPSYTFFPVVQLIGPQCSLLGWAIPSTPKYNLVTFGKMIKDTASALHLKVYFDSSFGKKQCHKENMCVEMYI